MNFSKIKAIIVDHFLSGLLVLAPILIVLVVFQWVFGGLLNWIENVPLRMIFEDRTSELAGIVKALLMLGLLFGGALLVSGLGFFSRLYFGKKIIQWIGEGIERIPFFGAIYGSLNQLVKTLSSGGGKQFSRVVYVEYPRKEVWAVGFVTGPVSLKGIPSGCLNIYVPTVPNPTSGFHLLVRESEVIESGLKVDEAFKMILSLGISQPHSQSQALHPRVE